MEETTNDGGIVYAGQELESGHAADPAALISQQLGLDNEDDDDNERILEAKVLGPPWL